MNTGIIGKTYIRKLIILLGVLVVIVILLNLILLIKSSSPPLKGISIIIDAGHGGTDTGYTDSSGFMEKDVNLQVALALRDILTINKANVEMTRETDISLENLNDLSKDSRMRDMISRITMINSGKYDLFISVHVNCSANQEATGPVVIYSPKTQENTILASCLQNALNRHSAKALDRELEYKPIALEPFILRSAIIPGIRIETGFISNPNNKAALCNASYRQKLVKSIYSGIRDFYNEMSHKNKAKVQKDKGVDESLPTNLKVDIDLVEAY